MAVNLAGKLVSDLNIGLASKELTQLIFTTNVSDADPTLGTLTISIPEALNVVFQIGNERMFAKYYKNKTFYKITRGYLSTPIEKHLSGDLIFLVEPINVKKYDSFSIYDVELSDEGLVLDGNYNISLIRGIEAITQDVRLLFESVGNYILNTYSQLESLDSESLTIQYNQHLFSNRFVQNIEITNITRIDDRATVTAKATIQGKLYENITFALPYAARL
jgi:hypothetical protein